MLKLISCLVIGALCLIGCGSELPDSEPEVRCDGPHLECPVSPEFPADGWEDLDRRLGLCTPDIEGAFSYNSGVTAECICCDDECYFIRTDCQAETEDLPGYSCLEDCCSERPGVYCDASC